jgi:hypothetical protein
MKRCGIETSSNQHNEDAVMSDLKSGDAAPSFAVV